MYFFLHKELIKTNLRLLNVETASVSVIKKCFTSEDFPLH